MKILNTIKKPLNTQPIMFQKSPFLYRNHIDARAFDFLEALATLGIEARLVGGCVRDAIAQSKNAPNIVLDIDIAIACPPDALIKACKTLRIHCIPTGLAHGTVTLFHKGLKIEATSLRRDIDTDGRHATVAFGTSFEEDACRRDFTMNALYVDHHGILYDAFDGAGDIHKNCVKFIGHPLTRIQEDALRLWRYFRFSGLFGTNRVDLNALPPLKDISEILSQLSIERVQSELLRILDQPFPHKILKALSDYGLWEFLMKSPMNHQGFRHLEIIEHRTQHKPCPIRRLIALSSNCPINNLPFRLSKAQMNKINVLLALLQNEPDIEKARHHIAFAHSDYWIDANLLLEMRRQQKGLQPCTIPESIQKPMPPFPLQGRDLIPFGIKKGPGMGHILNQLKHFWIEQHFKPTAKELLDTLKHGKVILPQQNT